MATPSRAERTSTYAQPVVLPSGDAAIAASLRGVGIAVSEQGGRILSLTSAEYAPHNWFADAGYCEATEGTLQSPGTTEPHFAEYFATKIRLFASLPNGATMQRLFQLVPNHDGSDGATAEIETAITNTAAEVFEATWCARGILRIADATAAAIHHLTGSQAWGKVPLEGIPTGPINLAMPRGIWGLQQGDAVLRFHFNEAEFASLAFEWNADAKQLTWVATGVPTALKPRESLAIRQRWTATGAANARDASTRDVSRPS
jgi:hypothetical protein